MVAPNVLIVDDSHSLRRTMSCILNRKGCRVESVEGGSEALRAVSQKRFDLIFLDYIMPDMDGMETYRRIEEISPETPVVLMTGYMEHETIQSLSESKALFLSKPIDMNQLEDILKDCLVFCHK